MGPNGSDSTEDGSTGSKSTGGPCGSLGPEGSPAGTGSASKICSMASLKASSYCSVTKGPGNLGHAEILAPRLETSTVNDSHHVALVFSLWIQSSRMGVKSCIAFSCLRVDFDFDLPKDYNQDVDLSRERPQDQDRVCVLEWERDLREDCNFFLCSPMYSFTSRSRVTFGCMWAHLSGD